MQARTRGKTEWTQVVVISFRARHLRHRQRRPSPAAARALVTSPRLSAMALSQQLCPAPAALRGSRRRAAPARQVAARAVAAPADADAETGLKRVRSGIKEAAAENALTPRFYTTDFDEMERLFSGECPPAARQRAAR